MVKRRAACLSFLPQILQIVLWRGNKGNFEKPNCKTWSAVTFARMWPQFMPSLFFVSADFANRIMRRRGNPTGCDQATKLFGLDVRLIHGSSFSKKMDRCGWKSRGETRRRTAK